MTGVLDHISRAERLLAEAATAEDVKDVIDAASFAAELSRRIGLSTDSINHALLIKAKALRRLAEVVPSPGHGGDRHSGEFQVRSPDLNAIIPRQRLAEARRIRDAFSEDDLEMRFAEATAQGREMPTSRLIADAKHLERETTRNRTAAEQAATSPVAARVWHSSWDEWLPQQPPCDLLLTDPPYSTDVEDVDKFAADWLPAALARVKPTGRAYICIGAYPDELAAYLAVEPPEDMRRAQVLAWTYRNTLGPAPTFDYKLNWQAILYYCGRDASPLNCPEMVEQFAVQDINAPDGRRGDRWHAWQKPDLLGSRFVRHSTKPGDLMLDPFAGTGTFLLAAARHGRLARGCEIDHETVVLAEQRGCLRAR